MSTPEMNVAKLLKQLIVKYNLYENKTDGWRHAYGQGPALSIFTALDTITGLRIHRRHLDFSSSAVNKKICKQTRLFLK